MTERRLAERLKRSEMRFTDSNLRRHADGHYTWLGTAGSQLFTIFALLVASNGFVVILRYMLGAGPIFFEMLTSGIAPNFLVGVCA